MVINGYTELLVDQVPADSEARENLEQVLIAQQRAKRLINQIVQFIRPEESKELILDPVPVVADVLTFMRSSLPSTFDIRQHLSATRSIIIDKEQLSRVLMNLCTNAAHAMEDTGGKMAVSLVDIDLPSRKMPGFDALSQGAYVELAVQDNGGGMDAETVKKIFDPYFSTKDKSKGVGLGLSIVHGIVAGVNGTIRVESQPGQGATFRILFPAVTATGSRPQEPAPETDSVACARGECILFVDDETSLVVLGRKRLEKLGYKVVTETDPMAALRKFKEQPDAFSLVITDMTMPEMTGDKLAREMATIRPGIPIIMCTGFNHRIDAQTSKRFGITALVNKPISTDGLAEVINRVLMGG